MLVWLAAASKTGLVSGVYSLITQGISFLMIPAFSPAISGMVLPKNWV